MPNFLSKNNILDQSDWELLGFSLKIGNDYKIQIHNERQQAYISYHRNKIFKKQGFLICSSNHYIAKRQREIQSEPKLPRTNDSP